MKKIIVSKTGFPGTTKTLKFFNEAYTEPLGALAQLAGDKTIVAGVTTLNGQVSDGFIVFNGEIIPFEGGAIKPNVSIVEEIENVNYNTSGNVMETLPAYRRVKAVIGTVAGAIVLPFSQLKRLKTNKEITDFTNNPMLVFENYPPPYSMSVNPNVHMKLQILSEKIAELEQKTAVFQAGGGMVLWNKPAVEIPFGWQEVVDWRGRMPVGMDISFDVDPETELPYSLNAEFAPLNDSFDNHGTTGRNGGEKTRTLVKNNLPAVSPGNIPNMNADGVNSSSLATSGNVANGTVPLPNLGTSTAFSILNPYRTVLFIEWTGN